MREQRVKFEVPDEKPKASAKRQRKAEEAADHAILKAIRERADGLPNADLSKATGGCASAALHALEW